MARNSKSCPNPNLNMNSFHLLSYHYVYRRQAFQHAVGSQQGWHEWILYNWTGCWVNHSKTLRAQRLKALWVTKLSSRVGYGSLVGHLVGFSLSLWRRAGERATWSPPWVQKGLDPVRGSLSEITEQHGRVSTQSAQSAAPHCRLHSLVVYTWEDTNVWSAEETTTVKKNKQTTTKNPHTSLAHTCELLENIHWTTNQ